MGLLDRLQGILGSYEGAASVGSGILAQPISGLAGILALPGGPEKAAAAVRGTQNALTYQPRTGAGQNALRTFGNAMEPVSNALLRVQQASGDAGYAMGGPVGGMLGATLPDAAMMALPLGARAGSMSPAVLNKQRGIFAGVNAKTANLAELEAAQKMAAQGVGRDEIWNRTGWFQGPEGKWRFEIDDSVAKFNPSTVGGKTVENDITVGMPGFDYGPAVGGIFEHKSLRGAYPDGLTTSTLIGNKNTMFGDGVQGSYANGALTINAPAKAVDARSTTLHELQHAIQEREGFAKGGNPEMMSAQWSAAKDKWDFDSTVAALAREAEATAGGHVDTAAKMLNEIGIEVTQEHIDQVMRLGTKNAVQRAEKSEELLKQYGNLGMRYSKDPGAQLYKRLAGEAEARAVQSRMNMTPAERQAVPPWQSYDTPWDKLIVRQ